MHHTTPLITTIVGALVLAFLLGMLANKLRISPLVGYLLAGVLAGPFTPGFVADTNLAPELAELGVILLMFGVGLHFSVKDLMTVKGVAIPGAIAQIAVASLLGLGLSYFLGWSLMSGIVFGLCLSTASTVVLLRSLEERQLVDSKRGRIAIGWLIVEDLVMVLTLVVLPAIAGLIEQGNANLTSLIWDLVWTIGKVATFMLLMMVIGRRVIPWILAKSAATGSRELFTLAVLALALGIAFGAVEFFDVSFALGAFFAGMVLNESELSHRAAQDTLPLRDAFAVLFFVSVGMLFDPLILIEKPLAVLGALAIVIIGKSLAAWGLVLLLGHSRRTALTIAASLAQIGEFAFILAGLGMSLNLLTDDGRNLVLAAAILSIMINPILFNLIDHFLDKQVDNTPIQAEVEDQDHPPQLPLDICQHAVVVGYGVVGIRLSEQLKQAEVPFVVIENSRPRVEQLHEQGVITLFGNAARSETMELARLDCASWLFLTIPNSYESSQIIAIARAKFPQLKIISRAKDEEDMAYILEQGADGAVLDEQEIANSMYRYLEADNFAKPVLIR